MSSILVGDGETRIPSLASKPFHADGDKYSRRIRGFIFAGGALLFWAIVLGAAYLIFS